MAAPTSPKPLGNSTPAYGWRQVHEDLENGNYVGRYGGDNAAYHGLAGVRAGVDMHKFHSKRSPDEFYVKELEELLKNPQTQRHWNNIITLNPMGMFATRPTMAATAARMMIPELVYDPNFAIEVDGKIVNEDKTINCVKCAIDWAWNLPLLAERLGMNETVMRNALADSTQNEALRDPKMKTYLPPVGGATLYFIGDISKLNDKSTEVAVRVHDECAGSDVFGTDICTCRPYLVFALQGAVQCAQRGGVGIIAYFKKEGRSLGEVTKFRVYNARKNQTGGDCAENYFKQTESIAGIRDARFQEMMPDVLLWLGIDRIDWLLSMSSDKYDAITGAGIEVLQRVSLPDMFVPAGATVEIQAKIASGYHSAPDAVNKTQDELRSLEAIRQRTGQIFEHVKNGKGRHFSLDLSKLDATVDFVAQVTKQNYADIKSIPYHSRWRHFNQADVDALVASWPCDEIEKVRRLIDLVTVSVFLDAGAGPQWHYIDEEGRRHERSEGLAIASFDMFKDGVFSSDLDLPHRVNGAGLRQLSLKNFAKGLQVHEHNPITGLEGRFQLFQRLGKALKDNPEFFGVECPRPGNIVDYVLKNANTNKEVSIRTLWTAVIKGFEPIWPEHLSGARRGDVWMYMPMKMIGEAASDLVPFHKLSQWLAYSMLEPLESMGLKFKDMNLMTGLAEYRNGGLFVDMGVIVPKKPEVVLSKEFDAGSEVVVEWRALTIQLLDLLTEKLRAKWNLSADELPLAKVLQGGTWAAGRIVAAQKRADRSSPIQVRLDGTVF